MTASYADMECSLNMEFNNENLVKEKIFIARTTAVLKGKDAKEAAWDGMEKGGKSWIPDQNVKPWLLLSADSPRIVFLERSAVTD